eukprot:gene15560-biopygen1998
MSAESLTFLVPGIPQQRQFWILQQRRLGDRAGELASRAQISATLPKFNKVTLRGGGAPAARASAGLAGPLPQPAVDPAVGALGRVASWRDGVSEHGCQVRQWTA